MNCPICGTGHQEYFFKTPGLTFLRCPGCGLALTDPSIPTSTTSAPRKASSPEGTSDSTLHANSATEIDAVCRYAALLKAKGVKKEDRILLIGKENQPFRVETEKAGWHLTIQNSIDFLKSKASRGKFDAVVLIYQLEKSKEPAKLLKKIYSTLKSGGILLITSPSLDSNSARFFGRSWTEWRPENRFYFDNKTLQLLLWRCRFEHLELQKDHRKYTLAHIYDRARSYPRSWVTRSITTFYRLIPSGLRESHLRLPSSGIIATGRRVEFDHPYQTCTIVVPAFNESKTFPTLMDSLIAKQLPGKTHKEIIIVESNSTDNTREQVLKYEAHQDVKIILQDHPQGKGNAVRAGFDLASGDILAIQDADLEYDLNDLDILLDPLIKFKEPFVLGSRHGGRWKMREFADKQGLSTFFNFGHKLFAGLLNLMYSQHLKDPFTMYKIFRRDCLHGLSFDANRFDFDFELVIKLIRKGYRPLEIPINYQSRSFQEGKKVRIFRDPLTWIWALIKYRFVNIYRTVDE